MSSGDEVGKGVETPSPPVSCVCGGEINVSLLFLLKKRMLYRDPRKDLAGSTKALRWE